MCFDRLPTVVNVPNNPNISSEGFFTRTDKPTKKIQMADTDYLHICCCWVMTVDMQGCANVIISAKCWDISGHCSVSSQRDIIFKDLAVEKGRDGSDAKNVVCCIHLFHGQLRQQPSPSNPHLGLSMRCLHSSSAHLTILVLTFSIKLCRWPSILILPLARQDLVLGSPHSSSRHIYHDLLHNLPCWSSVYSLSYSWPAEHSVVLVPKNRTAYT